MTMDKPITPTATIKTPLRMLQALMACLLLVVTFSGAYAQATAAAQSKPDRFYLPQPDQPFEGKVDTPIGTLEFSNQYPSKESVDTLLDSMDFHGATQA